MAKRKAARVTVGSYERRNQRARQLGYRNYYDYRIHGHGTRPPGEPVTPSARKRLAGHAGRANFLRSLQPGDLISLVQPISQIEIDARGRYKRIDKLVIDGESRQHFYTLRNLTRAQLVATIRAEIDAGAVFSPSPSLDQRRLVTQDELDA